MVNVLAEVHLAKNSSVSIAQALNLYFWMKLAQSMTDISSLEEAEKHIMLRAGIDLADFDDL